MFMRLIMFMMFQTYNGSEREILVYYIVSCVRMSDTYYYRHNYEYSQMLLNLGYVQSILPSSVLASLMR